ncbi:hypothetical protein AG4045_004967 [Apium graveolens]|uniref:Uncharacterized protein n=1 Tax=Apium graveolens TaxID=4045 RepID=A0A6L5B9Y3_APIGR|nr:hypothetical protein AG4045_004967 [Apium graveolens]
MSLMVVDEHDAKELWYGMVHTNAAQKFQSRSRTNLILLISATSNSIIDRAIDSEDAQHKDFLRLDHVEGYHELSAKIKTFLSTAYAKWDADYVNIDDDVHLIKKENTASAVVINKLGFSVGMLSTMSLNSENLERRATSLFKLGMDTDAQEALKDATNLESKRNGK